MSDHVSDQVSDRVSEQLFDDPAADPDYPTSTEAWYPHSHGERLLGVVNVPCGVGPHPGVLLLHGLPGTERNLDLAHALRRAGYVVAVCHYRGAWGSAGRYSLANVLEDCRALVSTFRADGSAAFRLDQSRLALVGHSLGGFAALMTAAAIPDVDVVVSVAGADFGAFGRAARDSAAVAALVEAAFSDLTAPLAGATAQSLLAEVVDHADAWSLDAHVSALARKAVLLVAGAHDTDATPADHFTPLVEAFEHAKAPRFEHRLLPADHSFSGHRIALARLVTDFLDRYLN